MLSYISDPTEMIDRGTLPRGSLGFRRYTHTFTCGEVHVRLALDPVVMLEPALEAVEAVYPVVQACHFLCTALAFHCDTANWRTGRTRNQPVCSLFWRHDSQHYWAEASVVHLPLSPAFTFLSRVPSASMWLLFG